ncbi:MAG: restriction endonuclease subunit S [Acidobacteriia bacterium]|nr:restriction endonuclease subunit S [Terriglobia bacterium]
MAGEWRKTELGNVITLQRGFDLPTQERRPGSIPIVSSSGISGIHSEARVLAPGVVTGRYGTIGQVFFIEKDFWPLNTTLFVKDFKGNDPRFISYLLRTIDFDSCSDKSSVPGVNRNHLHRLTVPVPTPLEQRAIAHTLGTLDDKIELNRRMNETLEAMARALFKSWFVDFDPVRAKAEGRQPFGMDAATAALFPNSFQDSPLGKIPKGWTVRAIGDVVTVVGGSTPRTDEPGFWEGTVHFATPKDMSSLECPILLETDRRITERGLEQISSGLLPKGTVLLSSRAPIGYLAVAEVSVAVNQGIIAMICDGVLPNLYVLRWTNENLDTIIANANGTTFLEISKANFRPIEVVVPPAPILRCFVQNVEPLYRQMVNRLAQMKTLAAIRDALLPKLISGEIRVKASE